MGPSSSNFGDSFAEYAQCKEDASFKVLSLAETMALANGRPGATEPGRFPVELDEDAFMAEYHAGKAGPPKPKVLRLSIPKHWFTRIRNGEINKWPVEMRQYWAERFFERHNAEPVDYKEVEFYYKAHRHRSRLRVEFLGVSIGKMPKCWRSHWKGDVYIISLGEVIGMTVPEGAKDQKAKGCA